MPATATKERGVPPAASGRWFDNGSVSRLERLPLFGDAMVGVARTLTAGFNALAASPSEVVFRGVAAAKIEDLIPRRPKGSVFVMVQAPGWNTPLALQFDFGVVSVMIEALFGSGEEVAEIPTRATLSAVESRIAELIVKEVCDALTAGFAGILPTSFAPQPIRAKPDPSLIGKPSAAVLVATLLVRAVGTQVEIDIAVPQAALDAFSDRLSVGPAHSSLGIDPRWTEKLEIEISRARMALTARLDLPQMTLREIARLAPGQVLTFATDVGQDVKLSCGKDDLFRCDLGQSNGYYTLRVGDALTPVEAPSRKDP